jgi:GAF domain-containing protein
LEGPCVEAAGSGGSVTVSVEVAGDDRWPIWGREAGALGIRGVLSVHLYAGRIALGAVNLYSTRTRDFRYDDLAAAAVVGGHLSIVMAHFRDRRHLLTAVEARNRIGQAQGILMHRYGIDADSAYAYLRRLSQHGNIRLRDIAAQVINNTHTTRDGESHMKPQAINGRLPAADG